MKKLTDKTLDIEQGGYSMFIDNNIYVDNTIQFEMENHNDIVIGFFSIESIIEIRNHLNKLIEGHHEE